MTDTGCPSVPPPAPIGRALAVAVTSGMLAAALLPAPAAAVVFVLAGTTFVGTWVLVVLVDRCADPVAAAVRGAATALVVLGGAVTVAATFGAAAVPLLTGVIVLGTAVWAVAAFRAW